jgi:hypothetical protein
MKKKFLCEQNMTSTVPFFTGLTSDGTYIQAQTGQVGREFVLAQSETFSHVYGMFANTSADSVSEMEWLIQQGTKFTPLKTRFVQTGGPPLMPAGASKYALAESLTLEAGTYILVARPAAGKVFNMAVNWPNGTGVARTTIPLMWATLASNPAGLSDGAIAGVVIGTVAGVGLLAGGGVLLARNMPKIMKAFTTRKK